MHKIFLGVFLLFIATFQARAEILPIDISKPHYQIGLSTEFYTDEQGEYDLQRIMQEPDSLFKPVGHDVSSHIFTNATFYYRFKVNNPQTEALSRLIMFETPWLELIDVRVVSPNQTVDAYTTGNSFPFSQRAVEDTSPNIEHPFAPGISTVYAKVKTRDPFIVPISVVDHTSYYQHRTEHLIVTTFIYGIILSMVLYHLILFSSIRLEYYGFYVLYLSSFLLMNTSYNNYTYQYLLSESPVIQTWMQSTGIFLFSIAGLLFARSFLNLKAYIPWAQRAINTLIFLAITTMLLSALFGYHIHVMLSIFTSVVFSVYVFSIALLSLKKGNRTARFFFFGTATGLIGTVITALTVTALIPYSHTGYRAIDFGMVIDCILLSFALVDRVKANEIEKRQALKAAVTDELTQLPNRRAYSVLCKQASQCQTKFYRNQVSAMMLDIDLFKQVNDTYGHDAGDEVLRHVANTLKAMIKNEEHIFRLGGEEFLILLPDITYHEARLIAERVRTAIEGLLITVGDKQIHITVSIGISEQNDESQTIQAAEKSADEALYRAKKFGRNQVAFSINGLV